MSPAVDTRDATAVLGHVHAIRQDLFPGDTSAMLAPLFQDVRGMFDGNFGDFAPVDLRYHDFQHTLQATVCMADLLAGRHRSGDEPQINARQFDLGITAVLLHDTGYLKTKADLDGTGAKYTYTHVLRSCAVAASYLPRVGVTLEELDGVLGAIRCTGPSANLRRLVFRTEIERLTGCCLATADYLSQMAADDYPEELAHLYHEFEESDDYLRVPRERRVFSSAADLIRRTPSFWEDVVQPRLRHELSGVHRYLETPYPGGRNRYLVAIEHNLARIARLVSSFETGISDADQRQRLEGPR